MFTAAWACHPCKKLLAHPLASNGVVVDRRPPNPIITLPAADRGHRGEVTAMDNELQEKWEALSGRLQALRDSL